MNLQRCRNEGNRELKAYEAKNTPRIAEVAYSPKEDEFNKLVLDFGTCDYMNSKNQYIVCLRLKQKINKN